LDQEINTIFERENSVNKQLQALVEELDRVIVRNYRLWPTNYIALDLLNQTDEHREHYSVEEKEEFQARIRKGVEMENAVAVRNFLSMYANPVIHKEKMHLLAP
jgi:hypothetical protein